MAISAACSKFPATINLCTRLSPVLYCVYSVPALGWVLASPRGRDAAGWGCSVEPFHYKLIIWRWLKWYWCALIAAVITAAAQWTSVIDAGAVPWTPAPHSPTEPDASHRRTACVTLSLVIQCGVFQTGIFFSRVYLIDKPHPLFRSPKSRKNCAAYSWDFMVIM